MRNGIAGCSSRSAISKTVSRLRQCGVQAGVLLEAQLLQLQVPVAELVPEEVPQRLRGFVKAVLLDGAVHLLGAAVQAAEDPAVLERNVEAVGIGFGQAAVRARAEARAPRRSAPYS